MNLNSKEAYEIALEIVTNPTKECSKEMFHKIGSLFSFTTLSIEYMWEARPSLETVKAECLIKNEPFELVWKDFSSIETAVKYFELYTMLYGISFTNKQAELQFNTVTKH